MSSLELYIGKSKYIIDCEESEKETIKKLASRLNERVNNLTLHMRTSDEKLILMLSSLMIEAELESAKESLNNASKNSNSHDKMQIHTKSDEDLENASFFIENLANIIIKY